MLLNFLSEHALALQQKTFEHIILSVFSLLLASFIAIPLGIGMSRSIFLKRMILPAGSISQTIPCLAMFGFLIPVLGLGNVPTIVVLTIYALYPILKSTFIGLKGVPEECLEAANGLGFSTFQKLWFVELPLALPVIISGLRIATSMIIGIASIGAFIGAGGLGEFIMQGLSLNDSSLILLGAIPTAFLALFFDYAISQLERRIQNKKVKPSINLKLKKAFLVSLGICAFAGMSIICYKMLTYKKTNFIVIASKNFPESFILAEMMAQIIENKTSLKVIRKFNLGTTHLIHQAMLKKEVDLYPEYTGTAYVTVLKKNPKCNDENLFEKVRAGYKNQFNFTWLKPFGFSNSQALAIKKDYARKHHIQSLSDLALISSSLNIAAPPEFLIRSDALPGLLKTYGLKFKNILQVDPNLMYIAIKNSKVDVIAAFSTDGKLQKYNLFLLADNKKFYPSYEAAPVMRQEIVELYPEIFPALSVLCGFITSEKIRDLNYQVDVEGKTPKDVVHQFLMNFDLD